jgi:uncharacterized protein RhaS with RHS repeats
VYYCRARYYHPGFQRFLSEDPIGFRGGINLYAYVRNRPTQYRDPWGLRPGDIYASLNAAGIAAACDAAGPTVQTGHEWGGWVYQVQGGWTYSEAVTSGKERTVDFGSPDPPRGTTAGWYHTHPRGLALPSPEDLEFSRFYGVPGFVWGRRSTFGGGGPQVVATFSGRKDRATEDLGSCPLPPDLPPAL